MTEQDLRDAIAARAAGEDLPRMTGLDAELEASEAARRELEDLTRLCALMREATPSPLEARRASAARRGTRRPLRTWLAASAVLTVALAAAALGIAKWREGRRTPVASEVKPAPGRPPLQELLGELSPADPSVQRAGEGDVRAQDVRVGGGPQGGPELSWLRPVAAQAGFRASVPESRPDGLSLRRAKVLRPAPGGPPSDALWLRYAGLGGELVVIETVSGQAARGWMDRLAFPSGWTRRVLERDGVTTLLASPSCDDAALGRIAAGLQPLPE